MITQAEQYLLELINRARLDPQAEADRYGIDLNQGLSAGTITTDAKQVLAHNEDLELAAQLHTLWMLDANVFSHTGEGGSSLRDRVEASGYSLSGSWRLGENLAWSGTTGTLNLEAQIDVHHEGLFLSSGHRRNLMDSRFREIGIAQEEGVFTSDGRDWNASMLTEKFAKSGSDIFVTGVVYDDLDANNFFSIGEGRSGAVFSVGAQSAVSADAGGYGIAVSPQDSLVVSISYQGFEGTLSVSPEGENVKVDLVDGNKVLLSKSATLLTGITDATLLGVADLTLTGSDSADRLTGNRSANVLSGGLGNDSLMGGEGADTLNGGAGRDTLEGGSHADRLLGGAENDSLDGGSGNDTLFGDDGNDTLRGGSGADDLSGGAGSDTFWIDHSSDIAKGGEGFDTARLEEAASVTANVGSWDSIELVLGTDAAESINASGLNTAIRVELGGGSDTITGSAGEDTLLGGAGEDEIHGGDQADLIFGGTDNDILTGGGAGDHVYGGTGNDDISGDAGNDFIRGEAGNDTIDGGENNDVVDGNEGNDSLNGGLGDDLLRGFDDDDVISGDDGHDVLFGGAGSDELLGGDGNDSLNGNAGEDTLEGGEGDDRLIGGDDNDLLLGDVGADRLFGGKGHDVMSGGVGSDILWGEDGDDSLEGGFDADILGGARGNDTLRGEEGQDTLTGGSGDDVLEGGADADVFVFADGFGQDTIEGFEASNDAEKIDLSTVTEIVDFADLTTDHMVQDTLIVTDVLITAGADTIRLENVQLSDLHETDFIFV